MDNREKLYEIAEISREIPNCLMCPFLGCARTVDECPRLFPPFTAEKQLALIKWLGHFEMWAIEISLDLDEWVLNIDGAKYYYTHKDFSQALAGFVIDLWEILLDEQKEEIRQILQ